MDSTITGRAYELSVMIRERGAKEFKECRVLEFSDLHVDEAEMTQQLKDTLETDTLTKFAFYKEHTIEVDDLEEGVPYKAAVSITVVMRSIVLYLEKGSNRPILPTRYEDIHAEGICMALANGLQRQLIQRMQQQLQLLLTQRKLTKPESELRPKQGKIGTPLLIR